MQQPMNQVIFVNRYFYPDHSATSQLLGDLAFDLAQAGYTVGVVTSRIKYDNADARLPSVEQVQGVAVRRVWTTSFGRGSLVGRAIDYLTFYISAFFRLLFMTRRGDVIVVKTDPPVISVVAATVGRIRGASHINWLQDLFPEVAEALEVPGISFLAPVIRALRNWSLRSASHNVAIGHVMAEKIAALGVAPEKITVINNWADGAQINSAGLEENVLRSEWGLENRFVVGYSGNLGRAHEYGTFINAAKKLGHDDNIVFLFIGGGAQFEQLKLHAEREGMENIHFRPYQPRSMLRLSLAVPDVHLVSLLPALEGLIVPSKFYGIAAAGRPTIFIGDSAGEISRILDQHACGITVPVNDSDALADAIRTMSADKREAAGMGERARALFEEKYERTIALRLWKKVLVGHAGLQTAT